MSEGLTKEQKALLDKLPILRQKVALGVLAGLSGAEAYRRAGGRAKEHSQAAYEILRFPDVVEFVDSVRNHQAKTAILKREDAIRILSGFAQIPVENAHFKDADPQKAIQQLRQMHGWDSVYKWDKPDEGEEDNQSKDEPVDFVKLAQDLIHVAREAVESKRVE